MTFVPTGKRDVHPCHPDACTTCHGLDWDPVHDAPCADQSWCTSYLERGAGVHVCELPRGHGGPHHSGAVQWE